MSSREIADITGKSHSNVMRDIRVMINELEQKSNMNFVCESSTYESESSGQKYPSYNLDRDTTDCLLTGYSAVLRMKVIKRWKELEDKQAPKLPTSFAEALQLAADQAKQLELAAPKVEFHDTVVQSDHTYKFQEAGKKIQQKPNKFVAWLRDNGYLMKGNIPYQKYIDLGVMIIHTGINDKGYEFTQGRITTKGLSYFSNKLDGIKL